jgi:hypothetical protein
LHNELKRLATQEEGLGKPAIIQLKQDIKAYVSGQFILMSEANLAGSRGSDCDFGEWGKNEGRSRHRS